MPSSDQAGLLLWLREWIPSSKILSLSLIVSYSFDLWQNDSKVKPVALLLRSQHPFWLCTRAPLHYPQLEGADWPTHRLCNRTLLRRHLARPHLWGCHTLSAHWVYVGYCIVYPQFPFFFLTSTAPSACRLVATSVTTWTVEEGVGLRENTGVCPLLFYQPYVKQPSSSSSSPDWVEGVMPPPTYPSWAGRALGLHPPFSCPHISSLRYSWAKKTLWDNRCIQEILYISWGILVRFKHLALSCRTTRPIALPVAWTANQWRWREWSVTMQIS